MTRAQRHGRLALAVLLALVALLGGVSGAGSPEKDYDILVRFRDSIMNWAAVKAGGNMEGWDDTTPAYLWRGVVLDFHLRVREINLDCYDFMFCTPPELSAQDPVFAELAKLDRLETLRLGGSFISGELPEAWAAPGAFPALQSLSLSMAHLNGALPRSWGAPAAFPALKNLLLDRNQLRGSLPLEWGATGSWPALEQLVLGENALSGSLPVSWGQGAAFPSLQVLDLSACGASGSLPPGWGEDGGFPRLDNLSLGDMRLSGSLPPEWASPGRFPKLKTLFLSHNQLGGSLPPEWGCEGCLPALSELLLMNNSLSGSLPGSWAALGALHIFDLSANRLEGQLPEAWAAPGSLPQLATLTVSNNSLSGSLPPRWGNPWALPALSWLDLSHNDVDGGLPREWGAPLSFPRLHQLYLHNNNLTGPLPTDWSLNSTLQQLYSLSLAHNRLTGTLPDSWGSVDGCLPSLTELDVGHNLLGGALPPSWGTSRSALASLAAVSIAGNNFTGEIPPNWGLLQQMHYLVLAPGNPTVCRTLPYVGQFVTCYGEEGTACQQPVQLRSNCSSDQPGWVPYNPLPQAPAGLSALQLGLVAAAASLVAACGLLGAVLVLRWRDQRRWQALKGMDAELALRDSGEPLSDLLAAAAVRKRSRSQHSALAAKLLKECAVNPSDIMFCRGPDGNLVQLGAGAYGQVYKAYLYGVHPVAVKVFQTQDEVPADDFWREISILRSCRHGSIVQFQGACVDGDATMMITELMDTDLYRALQSGRVSWYRHGLDIALDVAQALHFLHCRSIIHFDCKSPNILLSTDNRAKLADVGWAQILYHSYITGDGGTFNWAAPEQLIGLKCTAKADVYSYGLVLWELCTREVPVRGQIRDIRVPGEAPQLVVDLVRSCLDVDPAKRPAMQDIIAALQAEKERVEGAKAGPSSAAAPSPPLSSPHPGTGSSSSLGARGLDALPGPSMRTSSGSGPAQGPGASSGAAPRRPGHSGHSSAWGAGSSQDNPATRSGSSGGDGGGGSGSRPAGASLAGSLQPSLEGIMPVGRSATPASDGAWGEGSSGAGAGSSQGGGSGGAGAGGVFANSPWFTGGAALPPAQPAAAAGGSIFDGSAWAAGRPALALAPPGRTGAGMVGGRQGPMPFSPAGPTTTQPPQDPLPRVQAAAAVPVAPEASAAAGPQGPSIFAHSPWFNGNTAAAAGGAAVAAAAPRPPSSRSSAGSDAAGL